MGTTRYLIVGPAPPPVLRRPGSLSDTEPVGQVGSRRRQLLAWGGAATASLATGLWFWPTEKDRAAYPFARRLYGKHEPLWDVPTGELAEATEHDAERLGRVLTQLERAVVQIEHLDPKLVDADVDRVSASDRDRLREAWWRVFE